jgi:hypothetical protein
MRGGVSYRAEEKAEIQRGGEQDEETENYFFKVHFFPRARVKRRVWRRFASADYMSHTMQIVAFRASFFLISEARAENLREWLPPGAVKVGFHRCLGCLFLLFVLNQKCFHCLDEGYEILLACQAIIPSFQEVQSSLAGFNFAYIALRFTEMLRELHLRKA